MIKWRVVSKAEEADEKIVNDDVEKVVNEGKKTDDQFKYFYCF